MSFAKAVERVRAEFAEMPDLELTLPQAARLWAVGLDDCRYVLDALVDAGFLRWTSRRTVVRTGRALVLGDGRQPSDVPVRSRRKSDRSVSDT